MCVDARVGVTPVRRSGLELFVFWGPVGDCPMYVCVQNHGILEH